MKEAVIYNRKSQEAEDRQVLSIESQAKENEIMAKRNGYGPNSLLVFNESFSAKAPGRKEFTKMMEQVASGKIGTIFCWKLDRLARNPIDGGAVIWAMKQYELKIITPTQTYSASDDNVILMYIEFGMAHKYIDDLSRNVQRGNKTKLENGGYPGPAPLGYLNDRINKTILEDSERFPLVRKMWDLLLMGTYPVAKILDIANNEWGLRTPKRRKTGGTPLSRVGLYKLFRNDFYYGKIIRKEGEFDGSHKPMIEIEEFDRAQRILGKRGKPRKTAHNFAFTGGLIRCGECGGYVTAEEQVNAYGKHYVYYRCGRRKKGIVDCKNRPISLKRLEEQITQFLNKITITENVKAWCLKYLREMNEQESADRSAVYKSQQEAFNGSQKELDNLIDMRCRNLLSDEEFKRKREQLIKERDGFKEKMEDTEHRAQNWFELCEKTFEFASKALFRFQNGSIDEKRMIFDTIGANFVLKDRKLLIEAKKPFLLIADGAENNKWWAVEELNF